MKAIVCELCGSNELRKQDGLFVCQHCGTQYTTAEARKLLMEVEGTVRVSGVATTESLIQRGDMLMKEQRAKDALQRYNRVLDADPYNAEAARKARRAERMQALGGNLILRFEDPSLSHGKHSVSASCGEVVVSELAPGDCNPLCAKKTPGRYEFVFSSQLLFIPAHSVTVTVMDQFDIVDITLRCKRTGLMSFELSSEVKHL